MIRIGLKNRFSLLLLSESEHYFSDYSANYFPPKLKGYFSDQKKVLGRLIICSKSIMFDPENFRYPIIKLPFSKTIGMQTSGQSLFESGDCFKIVTTLVIEMKENNTIKPYTFNRFRGQHTFSLNYTSMSTFTSLVKQLYEIDSLTGAESKIKLRNLIQVQQEQILFDKTLIEEFSERIILESMGELVSPLVKTPGRILVTTQRIYFQPFIKIAGEINYKYNLDSIIRIEKRRHILQQIGLEIFMKDNNSVFFSFKNTSERDNIYDMLLNKTILKDLPRNIQKTMTMKWKHRLITNFEYLMYLNSLADRTINDITQYPVFPWVISDYSSETLELDNEKTFRDLSKPIGALNPERLAYFKQRYQEMPEPKFLYGTHYSTPGYVLYFLVRKMPECMLRLQNGKFDAPERMFHSIEETWNSVTTMQTDLKELIPEFFEGDGDFLYNLLGLDLGTRETTGIKLHDIVLPKWASSPKDFVRKNREALESEYVSQHLHEWIDLIFGFKQQGEEALKADNLFYYLTYEGAVDIEATTDLVKRESLEAQIREFGQTPKQLFSTPHVKRLSKQEAEKLSLNFELLIEEEEKKGQEILHLVNESNNENSNIPNENQDLENQNQNQNQIISEIPQEIAIKPEEAHNLTNISCVMTIKPHREIVTKVCLSSDSNTLYSVSQDSTLKIYSLANKKQLRSVVLGDLTLSTCDLANNEKTVVVGSWDNSIYFYSSDYGRVSHNFTIHDDAISCLKVCGNQLLTGSWDATVKLWNLQSDFQGVERTPDADFIENESEVKCIDMDPVKGICVSGSSDGNINIWDLKSKIHTQTIYCHNDEITGIKLIHNGEWIVSCSKDGWFKVHEMNSTELLAVDTGDPLSCLDFDGLILITGNEKGTLQLWDLARGKEIKSFKNHHKSAINSVCLSKDKRTLITAAENICVWK